MNHDAIEVKQAAHGQWSAILKNLAGLTDHQLTDRHQPCPSCGGTDRYRYDDKTENGDYYCNQCGAGDGLSLLMKVTGWDFNAAVNRAGDYLGLSCNDSTDHNAHPSTESLKRKAEQEAAEAERQRKKDDNHAKAAQTALEIWKAAQPATNENPYLKRKGVNAVETLREIDADAACNIAGYTIKSSGEPLAGKLLVVPIKAQAGNGDALSSVEFIDEQGRKHGLSGGKKKGGYWASERLPVSDEKDCIFAIGEGVATALSVKQAVQCIAVAAFSCNNLGAVAKIFRQRYPMARIIILADIGNGQEDAEKAAKENACHIVAPHFTDEQVTRLGSQHGKAPTDWNDYHQLVGLEAVRAAIEAALAQSPTSLPKIGVTGVTGVQPSNDVAFAVTPPDFEGVAGVSKPRIPELSKRPTFCVFDSGFEEGGTKYRPGVWHFGTDKNSQPTQAWICSPLHVMAVTFDGQDNNFGRLLRFKNTLGRWREWAMPMEMLRGAGDDLRGELLAMGVEIDPANRTRNLLASYLQSRPPKRRVRCALQVGWCGDSFVLPDSVIGPNAPDVIFQSGERGSDAFTRAGTLDGWRSEIAARAVGNPLLLLALTASFAGPLLARCNAEGGGVHFVGDSSTGKTTLLQAACSTWGGPSYRRSWRATANGMEGAAMLFSDLLLALDEISECDPREVGAIVYSLGNGVGKQRSGRTGKAREIARWKSIVLSSGERTIATTMQEGGHRVKAGQLVRLLDIPALRTFGAWDNLQGLPSGPAFSDAIKRATSIHYGHAGRAFLEKLTRDDRDFRPLLERINALPGFSANGGEGQDQRAAARFALFALAGELATEYGVTGWPEGEAIGAAIKSFSAWQSLRSHGNGNDERKQILERVSGFIERHGDGRFSNADEREESQIRDRAGWWRNADNGREYLFNSDGMREALKGFDFNRALDALREAGALDKPGSDGKSAKIIRIGSRNARLYPIRADKLEA